MLASSSSQQKRDRPKGIWKGRVTPRFSARKIHQRQSPPGSHSESDDDDEDGSVYSSDSKKQKHSADTDPNDDDETHYWDYSQRCSPYPDRVSSWETRKRIMDTSSTAGRGTQIDRETCDYEDWEDLKELFAKAAEQYESALSLIGMIDFKTC